MKWESVIVSLILALTWVGVGLALLYSGGNHP